MADTLRQALLTAVVPQLARTDPAVIDGAIASLPLHVRLGLGVAELGIGIGVAVVLTGRPLHLLDADGRERVVARLDRWAWAAPLLLAVKGTAALAWGEDPSVQRRLQGGGPP